MSNVFCFGEILLRLSPELQGGWLRHHRMSAFIGGAELNVATALSKWNIPVMYCSAMPDNYLSQEIIADIQQKGIDTSAFHFSGNRLGIYYLPQGADLKHAGVIYDRAHSSFADLKPGMINWDEAFKNVLWFHFSAISPAVSEDAAAVCEEALKAASGKGITISVDLNYRSKLWQYGKRPVEVMPSLVQYCDVIMGNVWAANTLLGIDVEENIHDNSSKESYLHHSLTSSQQIQQKFSKCKTVANTFRFDHKDGIRYFTALYQDGTQSSSKEFFADTIVDKVGSGDCFMAGLIYGLYKNQSQQEIIDFAASAAYGKLFEKGDVTSQDVLTIRGRLIGQE
ncbi:sugar kinase [Segetibacter koreensis]|uniref:sugar kinase n=1 Tax=Segetibacter koreensis TaxID=398037 RepID=UPI00037C871C|nr:sugar kinase [Segetibacter koreensis]